MLGTVWPSQFRTCPWYYASKLRRERDPLSLLNIGSGFYETLEIRLYWRSIILLWNATDVLTDTSVHTQLAEVEIGLHSDDPIPSVDEQHGDLGNNEPAHEDDNGKLCQLSLLFYCCLVLPAQISRWCNKNRANYFYVLCFWVCGVFLK